MTSLGDLTVLPEGGGALVVDPDPETRIAAAHILGRLGYAVRQARTRTEVELHLEDNPAVAVALVEVLMPRWPGMEAAAAIRAASPGAQVLYVSSVPARALPALRKGEPFLEKPFTMAALAEKLKALAAARPKVLVAGG